MDATHCRIMSLIKSLFLLLISCSLLGCLSASREKDPLKEILNSRDPAIRKVMKDPGLYEVQIRYTRILREGGAVRFKDYDFRVDSEVYFYPASTVKFPIAVLALEKLGTLDSLNRDTRYYIEGDSVENSFAEDIVKVFAVSDNHANNRLLEFLGQDAINERLGSLGVEPARISHRLGFHSDDVSTRPLIVYLNDSTTVQSKPIVNHPPVPLEISAVLKGRGYYRDDFLYMAPFDFGLKNYLPVAALSGLMKRVVFPETFSENERFRLNPDQREFLLNSMKIIPRKAGYDPVMYQDGYCKFFIYGDTEDRIPDHISIYNKVGFAYGTLTDCAYITDKENGVEFMLTATILVNSNGIFNDDQYEYDETGLPFLAALGRAVYQFELEQQ
ncbi:serine hydrolase [Robiginitalea sp. IMCC43444]|uniref:serine hydrolase n=1 Tax=Robiginitalea sp. IMCC43444 TaxID=3459121 RepID=UPI0040411066